MSSSQAQSVATEAHKQAEVRRQEAEARNAAARAAAAADKQARIIEVSAVTAQKLEETTVELASAKIKNAEIEKELEEKDSTLGSIEEDHTCPVCLEILDDPVYNSLCGHVFCRGCLVTLMDQKSDRRKSCPACRSTITTMRDPKKLPSAHTAKQVVSTLQNMKHGVEEPKKKRRTEEPYEGLTDPYDRGGPDRARMLSTALNSTKAVHKTAKPTRRANEDKATSDHSLSVTPASSKRQYRGSTDIGKAHQTVIPTSTTEVKASSVFVPLGSASVHKDQRHVQDSFAAIAVKRRIESIVMYHSKHCDGPLQAGNLPRLYLQQHDKELQYEHLGTFLAGLFPKVAGEKVETIRGNNLSGLYLRPTETHQSTKRNRNKADAVERPIASKRHKVAELNYQSK